MADFGSGLNQGANFVATIQDMRRRKEQGLLEKQLLEQEIAAKRSQKNEITVRAFQSLEKIENPAQRQSVLRIISKDLGFEPDSEEFKNFSQAFSSAKTPEEVSNFVNAAIKMGGDAGGMEAIGQVMKDSPSNAINMFNTAMAQLEAERGRASREKMEKDERRLEEERIRNDRLRISNAQFGEQTDRIRAEGEVKYKDRRVTLLEKGLEERIRRGEEQTKRWANQSETDKVKAETGQENARLREERLRMEQRMLGDPGANTSAPAMPTMPNQGNSSLQAPASNAARAKLKELSDRIKAGGKLSPEEKVLYKQLYQSVVGGR